MSEQGEEKEEIEEDFDSVHSEVIIILIMIVIIINTIIIL